MHVEGAVRNKSGRARISRAGREGEPAVAGKVVRMGLSRMERGAEA